MYCTHCGKQIDDNDNFCPYCGQPVSPAAYDQGAYRSSQGYTAEEGSSVGFGILGFIIPIVGFILFFIYHHTMPKRARASGIGALIGFLFNFISLIWLYVA